MVVGHGTARGRSHQRLSLRHREAARRRGVPHLTAVAAYVDGILRRRRRRCAASAQPALAHRRRLLRPLQCTDGDDDDDDEHRQCRSYKAEGCGGAYASAPHRLRSYRVQAVFVCGATLRGATLRCGATRTSLISAMSALNWQPALAQRSSTLGAAGRLGRFGRVRAECICSSARRESEGVRRESGARASERAPSP